MIHGLKLFACATSLASLSLFASTAMAADPIKIGVDGPFTGGSSSMGVSACATACASRPTRSTRPAACSAARSSSSSATTRRRTSAACRSPQELINKEKVVATVGYINTGVALASQRFYQDAKIPVMNNVATGTAITKQFDDQPDNYVFRNAANDSIQAPMIVDEMTQARLQEAGDPRRLDELRPARPRGPREGARRRRASSRRDREVQHQGRRHDGAAAEGEGGRRRRAC